MVSATTSITRFRNGSAFSRTHPKVASAASASANALVELKYCTIVCNAL